MVIKKFFPIFTAIVLLCFWLYAIGWITGYIDGTFEYLLFIATVVSLAYWLADWLYFKPKRKALARYQLQERDLSLGQYPSQGGAREIKAPVLDSAGQKYARPWWLDWTAGLFPVILIIFAFRSFAFESFHIPSGSMIPTLEIGDFVLVNKFAYGLRLPILGTRLTGGKNIERGDVIVFHYPPNPNENFIKRVVGLPGDKVSYINKRLSVNGQTTALTPEPNAQYTFKDSIVDVKHFKEQLGSVNHSIFINDGAPSNVNFKEVTNYQFRDQCTYTIEGVSCTVPPNHYFVMGDNRDNSLDSRYWGFVPERNVLGRAMWVWMNFSNFSRIGSYQ